MAHVQKQIRDAAVVLLNAQSSDSTWRKVFGTAQSPDRDLLPYVLVYFSDETIDPGDIHDSEIDREALLFVRLRVRLLKDGEALEDAMDHVAVVAEKALTRTALETELGTDITGFRLLSVERDPEVEDDNEREYAEVVLQYQVQYSTAVGDPENLI